MAAANMALAVALSNQGALLPPWLSHPSLLADAAALLQSGQLYQGKKPKLSSHMAKSNRYAHVHSLRQHSDWQTDSNLPKRQLLCESMCLVLHRLQKPTAYD